MDHIRCFRSSKKHFWNPQQKRFKDYYRKNMRDLVAVVCIPYSEYKELSKAKKELVLIRGLVQELLREELSNPSWFEICLEYFNAFSNLYLPSFKQQ